ncbi:MAG TPA: pyruvate kinase, partial [Ruminococcaceae bacterium]|nr:pyruvate kinase [Oscillospiraceae bacterium]
VCGNVCVCKSSEEVKNNLSEGDVLVVPETTNGLLPYLRQASAIIAERPGMNSHAAIVGLALDKAVIVGANNATKILKSGTTVTVDSTRGIVYSGNEKCPADF